MTRIDAYEVGNWLLDAPGVDVREFAERLMSRLTDRELDAIKFARRGLKRARKEREQVLMRARVAEAKREQHIRLAAKYFVACQQALSPPPSEDERP